MLCSGLDHGLKSLDKTPLNKITAKQRYTDILEEVNAILDDIKLRIKYITKS